MYEFCMILMLLTVIVQALMEREQRRRNKRLTEAEESLATLAEAIGLVDKETQQIKGTLSRMTDVLDELAHVDEDEKTCTRREILTLYTAQAELQEAIKLTKVRIEQVDDEMHAGIELTRARIEQVDAQVDRIASGRPQTRSVTAKQTAPEVCKWCEKSACECSWKK